MIVYDSDKRNFLRDNDDRAIEDVIHARYNVLTGRSVGRSELVSWRESLAHVARVLRDDSIPDSIGIAIEYLLPQTAKRIDVILSGLDDEGCSRAVIVELKQWETVKPTNRDGIVTTRIGGIERQVVHPSYQAWSYAAFLEGFNEAVYEGGIRLTPCAFLHNHVPDGTLESAHYRGYVEKAPLFFKGPDEWMRLRDFIRRHVKKGSGRDILYALEKGRIRPSKTLADAVGKVLKGHPEFVLLDDQKEVFEAALVAAQTATSDVPNVVIVNGGPGTGKSVVAINLLSVLIRKGLVAKYVSRNAAPREVYKEKLGANGENAQFAHLFTGSGAFMTTPPDTFDALIVDEAHRLTEKSGFYGNEGDHQVREIIGATRCSIFFLDEDQRVTLKDIGSADLIRNFAAERSARVTELSLTSQFRCNGSDGFLAWVDNTLQIRPTANTSLSRDEYDFRVFDDPEELHAAIEERNGRNSARVVAGYCWPWKSKKHPTAFDIEIGSYARRWNLTEQGSLWIVSPDSIDEVGCIHTCQGLEVEYIGVIIGPDMIFERNGVVTKPKARDRHDKSIKGYVKLSKVNPKEAADLADRIIRNTYRTLMTRGMKGCYVFATDPALRKYLRRKATPDEAEDSIKTSS